MTVARVKKIEAENNGAAAGVTKLRRLQKKLVTFTIVGMSPLVQHKWSEKAKTMMREKHAGKKTKTREIRDPKQEFLDAMYLTEDGKPGIPVDAIKECIVGAAHKDIGIEKTLVRKSLFIPCTDKHRVIPMTCSEPRMVEDVVTVGNGGTDLRYRPYYDDWSVRITCEIDSELLQIDDLMALVDRAGFGVGIGEMRPECGKEYGRFHVDATETVDEVTIS